MTQTARWHPSGEVCSQTNRGTEHSLSDGEDAVTDGSLSGAGEVHGNEKRQTGLCETCLPSNDRPLIQLILLLDFEAFGEGSIGEDEFRLGIAFRFTDFGLAFFAAESDLHTANFDIGIWIELCTGQRAFGLSGLASRGELMIGLGRKLGGVLLEGAWAFAAAEVNLATFVIDSLVFLGRLAGDGAGGLEWLGLFIGSECHHTNGQQTAEHGTEFLDRHGISFLQ